MHTLNVINLISQSTFKNDLISRESCLRFHTEQTHSAVQHTHTRQSFISHTHSHTYCVCKLNKSACVGGNTEEIECACTREDKRGQERVKACHCANEARRCKNLTWKVIPPHRSESHSFTNRRPAKLTAVRPS